MYKFVSPLQSLNGMKFSHCIHVIALRTFGPLLSLVLIANIGSCWWLQSLPVSVAHSPQHYDSQNSPYSCVLLLHSLTHTQFSAQKAKTPEATDPMASESELCSNKRNRSEGGVPGSIGFRIRNRDQ